MSLRLSSHYNLSRKQRGGDPGFPTTPLNAYQSLPLDDNGGAVLEKLDPTGRLKYSTFLSGNSSPKSGASSLVFSSLLGGSRIATAVLDVSGRNGT